MNNLKFIRREIKTIRIMQAAITMICISFKIACILALILCILKVLETRDTAYIVRISIIGLFLSINKVSFGYVRTKLELYRKSLEDFLNISDNSG